MLVVALAFLSLLPFLGLGSPSAGVGEGMVSGTVLAADATSPSAAAFVSSKTGTASPLAAVAAAPGTFGAFTSRRLPEIRSTSMRHTATRATASSENVTGTPGAMWAMTCVSPHSFSVASVTGRMRPQVMTLS